ncbi:HNH endonuclease [Maribacter sp. 2-571]|uniref:HNH endonuclease n=1 Tax=Maribacter sp. 2-571 TaxID=3417569 RepID=UPI003D328061
MFNNPLGYTNVTGEAGEVVVGLIIGIIAVAMSAGLAVVAFAENFGGGSSGDAPPQKAAPTPSTKQKNNDISSGPDPDMREIHNLEVPLGVQYLSAGFRNLGKFISSPWETTKEVVGGFAQGISRGLDSTVGFVESLGTAQGWMDFGQGIGNAISDFAYELPNMTPGQISNSLGYGAWKGVEGFAFTRGAGMARSLVRTTSQVSVPSGQFYSVAHEMALPRKLYPGGSYYQHFKAANKSLAANMDAATMNRLNIKFKKSKSGNVLWGRSPENWVWHHDIQKGIMQLVPKAQHSPSSLFWNTLHPNGFGGMHIWN